MTKKNKKVKEFLEQLNTIPNISIACEKVGLARNTIYRWCKEDKEFQENVNLALSSGVDSITDLAESKLVGLINKSDFRAISYWLSNNKRTYVKPRPKDLWKDIDDVPITTINIVPYKDPLNMPIDQIGDINDD